MIQSQSNRAIERARWLAELGRALDIAERLAFDLADSGIDVVESDALARRLGWLRVEVEQLRTVRRDEWPASSPLWTNMPAGRSPG